MTVAYDVRSAFRSVRRPGALRIAVVLLLAVPIGAVTAISSIAYAVLLRPLPVVDPDRVVVLWGRDDARSQSVVEVSLADVRAWRAGGKSLAGIEVFGSVNWGELGITAPGERFSATMNAVSAGFFDVLGTRPIVGRTFRPEDDLPDARKTVVLSGDLWRRRFASDVGVAGRILRVGDGRDAEPYEIIGVMPPDFRIPPGAEVWVAIGPALAQAAKNQRWNAEGVRAMYAVGRLERGATIENAIAELSTIARAEEIKLGVRDSAMTVVARPLVPHLLGPARPALLAIWTAAGMLLLIGCANAAGLLLVDSASRRREVAVRLALGARRSHIVVQRLCESLLLSVLAGALGLALAYVSFDAIVALAPSDVPRLDQAAIDWRALLFACAVSVATAMAVGLLPAWRDSADDAVHALQHRLRGGIRQRASNRITKVLVAAQIAVAVVLLTGAGLFARSFAALMRLDLGFDPRNVLTFHLTLPESRFVTRENRLALVDAVIDRVRRLPDVVGVGAVYQRPFAHGPIGMDAGVIVEGQPLNADSSSRNPILNWEAATPEYFRAMDIRLLSGRSFNETDTEKAPPVVIISESLGRRLLPGQDPIGRRILAYVVSADEKHPAWQTIVGVVEDARYREIQTPRYDLYLPYRQAPEGVRDFVVRVTRDPAALVPQLRTAVATIDLEITVDGIFTLNQVVGRVLAPWRFSTVVVSVFSILALTLAAAGVMALLAYAVTQRTWEIGVRMALGAQRRQVVGLIVKESLWMSAGGLAAGMLTAWTMRQSVSSMLFGVSPGDHVTFAVVPGLLIAAGLVAAYIPARRAARIDPAVTLRSE